MPLTKENALRKDVTTGKAGMEHRHFATIADIIRGTYTATGFRFSKGDRDAIAEYFADELRSTNPRFDRARFLRACGVEA